MDSPEEHPNDILSSYCQISEFEVYIKTEDESRPTFYNSLDAQEYEKLLTLSFNHAGSRYELDASIGIEREASVYVSRSYEFYSRLLEPHGDTGKADDGNDLYDKILEASLAMTEHMLAENGLKHRSDFDQPSVAGKTLISPPEGFHQYLVDNHLAALAEYDMASSLLDYGDSVQQRESEDDRWLGLARAFSRKSETMGYDVREMLGQYQASVSIVPDGERSLSDVFKDVRQVVSQAVGDPVDAHGRGFEISEGIRGLEKPEIKLQSSPAGLSR